MKLHHGLDAGHHLIIVVCWQAVLEFDWLFFGRSRLASVLRRYIQNLEGFLQFSLRSKGLGCNVERSLLFGSRRFQNDLQRLVQMVYFLWLLPCAFDFLENLIDEGIGKHGINMEAL